MTLNEELINLQKAVDNLKYEIYKAYKITKIKTKRKMRKLLTFAALFISLFTTAQTEFAMPVIQSIDGVCGNVNPTRHRGDVVRIGIKVSNIPTGTWDNYNQLGTGYVKFIEGSNYHTIFSGVYAQFTSLNNYSVTCGATGYVKYIDYTIPMTTQLGVCTLQTMGGSPSLGGWSITNFSITIVASTTGIEELTKENIKSISYYDLKGIEVSNIESNTLYIKKTTYNNGYIKSEKIIQQ